MLVCKTGLAVDRTDFILCGIDDFGDQDAPRMTDRETISQMLFDRRIRLSHESGNPEITVLQGS